ncbi:aminoglycoside 6-adenylyltransferase [Paenibacillus sp. N1-5-1-14]|uniref:aminoglycoside 6-adenylyltransferase n=1 Tax=Paenibacillus radicibacter TaxID=2972488 RepID=UPI002159ABAE|nr:aminoglycoside 6-adenylyltransferase [Paenibacillus radicibacter]MCR8644618.1 aminoglycoside 6-adenylyltransferase [Paenibacillus radicibacter]
MRSEQEMFELILGVADRDERIRAVYMNGSRTNPNVPKDMYQDYDIVYMVTETASFIQQPEWVEVFGEQLIRQEPDLLDHNRGIEMDFNRSYMCMMLFTDGNRLDLRLLSIEALLEEYKKDSLTIPLLDKDNILPQIPPSTDRDYHVKRPTEPEYVSCCNDFWWCMQNVAKGIARDELPYAKTMFDQIIRERLDEMLAWWVGGKHDYQISVGKMGKYFKNLLPAPYWDLYKQTYADADDEHTWGAVFTACELLRQVAQEVASQCHFTYVEQDDWNMMLYLNRVYDATRQVKEA